MLDRRGKLITQFFSEEKREIVPVTDLPKHLLYALLAKEDQRFFSHGGFSVRNFFRAVWNNLFGSYFSGGSTISQQVAGNLYEDRDVETLARKFKELWWSFQLEKKRSKYEIIEIYLNNSSFGHGTYGVEAASQFYFGHSARSVSLAESALLVVPLSHNVINSPIRNPNRARKIQISVLDSMVELGYATREEAEISLQRYWERYEPTRPVVSNAYTERQDRAPLFSEYVQRRFDQLYFGVADLNRDGLTIHTTLDLQQQRLGDRLIDGATKRLGAIRLVEQKRLLALFTKRYLPILETLKLAFPEMQTDFINELDANSARKMFEERIAVPIDALSLLLGQDALAKIMRYEHKQRETKAASERVQGALVALDSESGAILSMVGGSSLESHSFNRVTDAKVPVGTAITPLYYAEAIESENLTSSSMIFNSPVVYENADGSFWMPYNYLETWSGPVSLSAGLSESINIPSVKVFAAAGLDASVSRIALLLDEAFDKQTIHYNAALEGFAASPLQLTRAYTAFAGQGKLVTPFAIRYVEDRYGNIIFENESRQLSQTSRRKNVISPQTAYIISDMLSDSVQSGALSRRVSEAGGFDSMAIAAKSGTTKNWSDAWVVGYSPFVAAAVWLGFDGEGNSLGRYQTGALAAGPVWVEYMKQIHEDLPRRRFEEPHSGLIKLKVCAVSGLLPSEDCNEGLKEAIFLTGSEPQHLCNYHSFVLRRNAILETRLAERIFIEGPAKIWNLSQEQTSDSSGSRVNSADDINPLLQ